MIGKRTYRACRSAILVVAFFSLFVNVLMLVIPLYMLQVYDRVLASRSEETLAMLTVAALGALVVLGVLEGVRSRILVRVGAWLERALAPELLGQAVRSALSAARATGAQGLRDLAAVRGFLGGAGIFHLFDAPWVPLYLGVIYLLHPLLGTTALIGGLVLFAVAGLNEWITRRPLGSAGKLSNELYRRAEARMRNAEVIEAMGMLPAVTADWQRENEQVIRLQSAASDRAGTLAALTRFLRLGVQVGILGLGALLAIHQEITAGAMIAASILLARALAPVEQAIGTWRGFVNARAAWDRIRQSLDAATLERGSTTLPVPTGIIDVENATVVAPGREAPVLRNVSFHLDAGETLGVIGPSAAGKTSLARLLVGIWPAQSGKARLDGADVFTWQREDLGRHIGYLPQDVELFDGTVKQNIARMGEARDEDVIMAARLAGVHEIILGLPLGYDTLIGEGGIKPSGGQRQRLALARAFYGRPRLLVLDEPNANLDSDGEEALMRALAQARQSRVTTVIIAHRIRVLAATDRILLLRDGRAELFGEREAVLARLTGKPAAATTVAHLRKASPP